MSKGSGTGGRIVAPSGLTSRHHPRALSFGDRFTALAAPRLSYDGDTDRYTMDAAGEGAGDYSFRNPDFNIREMRATAVLRWEYLPGSTLFLVWSHDRSAALFGSAVDDAFDLGRDVRRLFNADRAFLTPGTSVLLVKVNYWISF